MIPEPSSGDGCFQIYMLPGCFPHTPLLNLILLIRIFPESISFCERGCQTQVHCVLTFRRCSEEQITQQYWEHDRRSKPNNFFFLFLSTNAFPLRQQRYSEKMDSKVQCKCSSALLVCCAIMFLWGLKGFQDGMSAVRSLAG